MVWVKTDQGSILLAIRDRLIDQIAPDFTPSTCFVTATPEPPETPAPVHNVFCTVAPDNSTFNEGVFEGAGEDALEENAGVIVTIFSRIKTDRGGHAVEALTNATRGLLSHWKKVVLKALAGLRMLDGDGNEIVDNLIFPRTCSAPSYLDDNTIGISISFDTEFDWDLE